MSEISEIVFDELIYLKHLKTGYSLTLDPENNVGSLQNFFFTAPINVNGDKEIMITGRSIHQYDSRVLTIPLKDDYQYIEVGAGLGEFVSYLYSKIQDLSKKPIVIDLANYEVMLELLIHARKFEGEYFEEGKIESLIKRAELILDSSKVKLYNMTLLEAHITHPELKSIADVLIDNQGAYLNYNLEKRENYKLKDYIRPKIILAEREFVKSKGIIIVN